MYGAEPSSQYGDINGVVKEIIDLECGDCEGGGEREGEEKERGGAK